MLEITKGDGCQNSQPGVNETAVIRIAVQDCACSFTIICS